MVDDTGVDPKRMIPAMHDLEEVNAFKRYFPDLPWAWFGGFPDNPQDDQWYLERINLGCAFFEIYYTIPLENSKDYQMFEQKVHQYGATIWAFETNVPQEIRALEILGVDGVETEHLNVFLDRHNPQKSAGLFETITTGNWTFDQGQLSSEGIGSQLRPLAYYDHHIEQSVTFGTTTAFNISPIGGQEALVMKVPAFNPHNGLMLFDTFIPREDAELHYNYTLVMDLYLPKPQTSRFISLFQTNPLNENDGDFFIDLEKEALGVSNQYHGDFTADAWHRIAIAVGKEQIHKYVDGSYLGSQDINGGRWSVINSFPGGQDQGTAALCRRYFRDRIVVC